MTSSKPYLVRALYEWILDNDNTPYILVDSGNAQVLIPPGIANDGKVAAASQVTKLARAVAKAAKAAEAIEPE